MHVPCVYEQISPCVYSNGFIHFTSTTTHVFIIPATAQIMTSPMAEVIYATLIERGKPSAIFCVGVEGDRWTSLVFQHSSQIRQFPPFVRTTCYSTVADRGAVRYRVSCLFRLVFDLMGRKASVSFSLRRRELVDGRGHNTPTLSEAKSNYDGH